MEIVKLQHTDNKSFLLPDLWQNFLVMWHQVSTDVFRDILCYSSKMMPRHILHILHQCGFVLVPCWPIFHPHQLKMCGAFDSHTHPTGYHSVSSTLSSFLQSDSAIGQSFPWFVQHTHSLPAHPFSLPPCPLKSAPFTTLALAILPTILIDAAH